MLGDDAELYFCFEACLPLLELAFFSYVFDGRVYISLYYFEKVVLHKFTSESKGELWVVFSTQK